MGGPSSGRSFFRRFTVPIFKRAVGNFLKVLRLAPYPHPTPPPQPPPPPPQPPPLLGQKLKTSDWKYHLRKYALLSINLTDDQLQIIVTSIISRLQLESCLVLRAHSKQLLEMYSNSKVKRCFKTMHRCSSLIQDTSTNPLQVEDSSVGLSFQHPISSTHERDRTDTIWNTRTGGVKIKIFTIIAWKRHKSFSRV